MRKFQRNNKVKERITAALISSGISPVTATFVFSQAAHETGNFTSFIFFANNNCFGMKQPKKRKTVSLGEKNGYASYQSIEDSAKDYALYYKAVQLSGGLQTIDQFVDSLHNKGYFEADIEEYRAGVKHFYNLYYGNVQYK